VADMSQKLFFYKLIASELFEEVSGKTDDELVVWIKSLAADLIIGKKNKCSCAFSKKLITEAEEKAKKRSKAGSLGGLAKSSNAKAKLQQCSSKGLPSISTSISTINNKKDLNPSSPQNKFEDEDMRFAHWMFSLIESLAGNHKEPNFKKWANTVRLMRERDGLSLNAIGTVFKWANNDDFWQSNVLSPEKLRAKFSQLSAKALRPEADGKKLKTFAEQKMENTKKAMTDFAFGEDEDDDGFRENPIRQIDW
jgi:hypothetical protein